MQKYTYQWSNPVELARAINGQGKDFILLHSTMDIGFTGRYSILAFNPIKTIKSNGFKELENQLSNNKKKYDNTWFGYLGYELLHELEDIPKTGTTHISLPPMWMTQFAVIVVFDHRNKTCNAWSESLELLNTMPNPLPVSEEKKVIVGSVTSNMTKEEYCHSVETILAAIERGDLYQANITRKFYGQFKTPVDEFELFTKLCEVSPAPYSAYVKIGDVSIISSSPEQFLTINDKGQVESRPIKGSAPRFKDKKKDQESLNRLISSTKDKAENLMIVDLMRNDFSRGCIASTVKVEKLFDTTSYKTVHHMASNIMGEKEKSIPSIQFVKNCFPPGSMTGAPKIKAMEYCADIEKLDRGVYSGAIGWFGGDGSADLSVVIRTLIIQKNKFEFQVGGAIVADSTPEGEWEETLVKSRGIAKALGLNPSKDLAF